LIGGEGLKLVKAAGTDELADGQSKVLNIDGNAVVLFRVRDDYFAISNTCLHRGGPLGEGELNGYEVTCPWHGWKYDVRTGSFTIIPTLRVRTFNVKIVDGSLFVEV